MTLLASERETSIVRFPAWWLGTVWFHHRHAVETVHPLLVDLQDARGSAFMTCGHVLDVLDAKDPAALVRSWIDATPTRRGQFGLPARTCSWRDGDEPCGQPVRAVNAKFCESHATVSRRRSTRLAVRRSRGKQSGSPSALGNQGFAEGADPLPGIQVFPKAARASEARKRLVGEQAALRP